MEMLPVSGGGRPCRNRVRRARNNAGRARAHMMHSTRIHIHPLAYLFLQELFQAIAPPGIKALLLEVIVLRPRRWACAHVTAASPSGMRLCLCLSLWLRAQTTGVGACRRARARTIAGARAPASGDRCGTHVGVPRAALGLLWLLQLDLRHRRLARLHRLPPRAPPSAVSDA